MWCRVARTSCQRTEQSAPSLLFKVPGHRGDYTLGKRCKLLERFRRQVCRRKSNERKETIVNIMILTKITGATAFAGVNDLCRSRLALVSHPNSLQKDINTCVFGLGKLPYLPTMDSTRRDVLGNSDDGLVLVIGSTAATKAGIIPSSLQAESSAS